jgi:pimeloyl-ACP methyl ester carboxylesterase
VDATEVTVDIRTRPREPLRVRIRAQSLPPVILPLLMRLGRAALRSRGFGTRFAETPLGPVFAYDARGSGSLPPVAVLHGLAGSATPFAPLMTALLPHVRRVVAADMPGHGFSGDATGVVTVRALFDAMTAALDTLLDEPTVLLGNSLGGALALHYAIVRPQRVRGLVLLSPAGARVSDAELRSVMAAFDFKSRAEAIAFLSLVFHRVPGPLRLAAHELPGLMSQRQAVRDILASITSESLNPPEALAALAMPVLLVWGKSERLLPASTLAWYRANLPRQTIVEEPEGVGHVPPPGVAERIVEFLGSSPLAREIPAAAGAQA